MTNRKNFLRDLEEGKIGEKQVISILSEKYQVLSVDFNNDKYYDFKMTFLIDGKKSSINYEVKYDKRATRSGNFCFEIKNSKGDPSGVCITKAKYFIYNVPDRGIYQFKTSRLKQWLKRNYNNCKVVYGGDNNAFKLVLVPMDNLINKAFCTTIHLYDKEQ